MTRRTIKQYGGEPDLTPLDFVMRLVTEHRDTDVDDLPELHRYLDGDLINRFLRKPPAAGELRFRWDGVTVTLSADRTVEVTSTGGEGDTLPSNGGRAKDAQSNDDRSEGGTGIRVTTE